MPRKEGPVYNLKAVIRETGLKPDTLRAWERRYGMPKPDRTPGKHRLYSQRDIDTLKWLIARQQEGLSISRAVELWRSIAADGQDPLQSSPVASTVKASLSALAYGDAITDLRAAWVSACTDYDEQRAKSVLTQAFALYPAETVCIHVLQKGLADIGQGWYEGSITVQQEHFTSALALRRLDALIAAMPAPTRSGCILVACPAHEEHTFGPLLITFMLRRQGWDAPFLGANVPLARLESALAATRAKLVVASAQQLHTAANLLDMAHLLRREKVALAFGGLIFNRVPGLRDRIPGYFLGETLEEAPQAVERIMESPLPAPAAAPALPEHRAALVDYRARRAQIEADVLNNIAPEVRQHNYLDVATANLAHEIEAALILGDMEFLDSDIAWIEGLLISHGIPPSVLHYFLDAYRQAVESHMGSVGAPIAAWLATIAPG
ncbi:MAG TPA: MerR family transcriptional regulator [Anaerolineae bacterium]|nr:MerR family transcriptional regulator [Anaerolineae bacterium]